MARKTIRGQIFEFEVPGDGLHINSPLQTSSCAHSLSPGVFCNRLVTYSAPLCSEHLRNTHGLQVRPSRQPNLPPGTRGLFTTRLFVPNEVVNGQFGTELDVPTLDALYGDLSYSPNDQTPVGIRAPFLTVGTNDDGTLFFVDAALNRGFLANAQHAADPNCELLLWKENGMPITRLRFLRAVGPNQEITVQYVTRNNLPGTAFYPKDPRITICRTYRGYVAGRTYRPRLRGANAPGNNGPPPPAPGNNGPAPGPNGPVVNNNNGVAAQQPNLFDYVDVEGFDPALLEENQAALAAAVGLDPDVEAANDAAFEDVLDMLNANEVVQNVQQEAIVITANLATGHLEATPTPAAALLGVNPVQLPAAVVASPAIQALAPSAVPSGSAQETLQAVAEVQAAHAGRIRRMQTSSDVPSRASNRSTAAASRETIANLVNQFGRASRVRK